MKERKTAQIIIRCTEEDRAWVDSEAEKLGLDGSSFVRMMLRRARIAQKPAMNYAFGIHPTQFAPDTETAPPTA